MVFEGLAEKLQNTLQKLKGKGKLSESDVKDAMREVKLALLEADVNYKVVKDFTKKVTERCVGHGVLESLTPGQQVVKIVNEELTNLMGTTQSKINFSSKPPTIIMLVGLQGAGKTTTGGKLGGQLKTSGKRPLLVACDIYRPAAIKQLQVVGESLDLPVFSMGDKISPVNIAKAGIEHAKKYGNDIVIIDTAGRLHIDEKLMDELKEIKNDIKPHEIMLVVDAMTGQDAVNVAQTFNNELGIDGIILTKLDGDTRGGAALSVRSVTNKPIKYIGVGEKLTDLEPFHPDRLSSRILGMGDVLSLIEKAQSNFDESKLKNLEKKLKTQDFNLEDFLDQLQQMKNMGPISQILEMIPGANNKQMKNLQVDDKELIHIEAVIQSMTPEERQNPNIIKSSRRKRIAKGSGTSVQEVNKLLKQFEQTKKMMKQFSSIERGVKKGGKFKMPFF
ncbi:MAG: signal recognition particle protein [Candidatus Bathyarchaeota archaeon]|nr:signal recognition particle protein [Candidatus Bathyarchaeota archaeon]